MTDAHSGKTRTCYHDDADTDAPPLALTYDEHGRYLRSLAGTDEHGTPLRDRFESAALRFDCPECGAQLHTCPVCSDPDDDTAPGWFRGASTFEPIPCHNCNQQEIARQRRRGTRGARF